MCEKEQEHEQDQENFYLYDHALGLILHSL